MFTFSPLDHDRKEIRLLTIAPGAWDNLDDILNCEILHIARMKTVHTHDQNDGSVDDDEAMQERQGEKPRNTRMSCGNEEVDVDDDLETGSYETISYAWGDPAQRATILLNGVTFDIAKSSEQALRRVRLLHRPRTVWIDAVCINQTDIAERSQQVAIMADIYRSGRRNIVYLGEATSSTGTAINSINHLMDTAIADAINDGQSLVDKVFSSDGSFRYDPAGLQLASNEDALAEFYSRPWFSRLWVLQEAALAQQSICFCGRYEIALSSVLMTAVWLIHKLVRMPGTHLVTASNKFGHMRDPHSLFGSGYFEADLLKLLADNSRDSLCTDPRDKVYAIVGLMDWPEHGLPDELRPDYSRSVTDVLSLAGSWAINSNLHHVTDRLLRHVLHRSNEDLHLDGLPSWIPRWHRSGDQDIDGRAFRRLTAYKLTHNNSQVVTPKMCSGSKYQWVVEGICIGPLVNIVLGIPTKFSLSYFAEHYVGPLRGLVHGCYDHKTIDVVEAQVLTASRWADRGPLDIHHIQVLHQWIEKNMRSESPFSTWPEEDFACGQAVLIACQSRTVAKTATGNPALVPRISLPGDVVVWINRSDYPTVLRPCGENYEVIGQAYIHGIMAGEAIEAWRLSESTLGTFTLV